MTGGGPVDVNPDVPARFKSDSFAMMNSPAAGVTVE
jgi:hypothetical protein